MPEPAPARISSGPSPCVDGVALGRVEALEQLVDPRVLGCLGHRSIHGTERGGRVLASPALPREEPDIVVVGAGIIGLAVARELLAPRARAARVTVLEREPVTGFHQTGHNSGVLHAGIYYAPGSLKARLCTEGAPELLAYCQERGIPARQDGKLIVAARRTSEVPRLDELERRGRANGVPGLKRLRPEEIAEFEPHVRGVDALHSPATAVVDFRPSRARSPRTSRRPAARSSPAARSTAPTCAPTGSASATPRREPRALRGLLRRRRGRTGSRSRRAATPTRASSRSAAPGCACGPSAATSCARSSTRCPTPTLPFLGVHFTRGTDDEVLIGPTALLAGARDAERAPRRRATCATRSPGPAPTGWPAAGGAPACSELRHAAEPPRAGRATAPATSPS